MGELQRQSPIQLPSRPLKTEVRDHWVVVTAYEKEGDGPWLVDLSHKTRWDYQDGRLDDRTVGGGQVPAAAGQCRLESRILVTRMNLTQAAIWHLDSTGAPPLPAESGYTDVSEATAFLALLGPNVFAVAEKLTALDMMDPSRTPPFLLQGPFSHVACQSVILERKTGGAGAFLLTCARGYAQDMVAAISTAGEAYGLCPAGEDRFTSWLLSMPA
jgi:hypothetical protein